MNKKSFVTILILFAASTMIQTQSALFDSPSGEAGGMASSSESFEPLPSGYRNVLLGMPLEQVKTALLKESRFDYRGEPDVSLQDNGDRYLISCKGRGVLKEGFFQFNENKLYLIHLVFDRDSMDFYTLQQTLIKKYGMPRDLSPDGMKWENESVILSLEYPLTLKYLDRKVFEGFISDAVSQKGFHEINRDEFLKDF